MSKVNLTASKYQIQKVGYSTLVQKDLQSKSDCSKVPKSKTNMQYFDAGTFAKQI